MLILLVGDLIWPIIRMIITFPVIIMGILGQIILCVIGLIAYSSKIMAVKGFQEIFWESWSGERIEHIEGKSDRNEMVTRDVNLSILVEIVFETVPQIAIQLGNNVILYKGSSWPPLAATSFSFSVLLVVAPIYHYFLFWFVRRYRFEDIPEFDLIKSCLSPRQGVVGDMKPVPTIEIPANIPASIPSAYGSAIAIHVSKEEEEIPL